MGWFLARKSSALLEEVLDESNLLAAWRRVRRGKVTPGIDGLGVESMEEDLPGLLRHLCHQVRTGTYRPDPALRFYRPKAGGEERPLCVLTLQDRLVQRAIHQVLAPRLDGLLSSSCFGFRRGIGVSHALARLQELRKRGLSWVAQGDIDNYFDSIDREHLCEMLRLWLKDNRLLEVLKDCMESGVVEMGVHHRPRLGVPQGSVLSPLFSNLYLADFDRQAEQSGAALVRYADDMVFLARSRCGASGALRVCMHLLADLGLKLNRKPLSVRCFREGFEFLGHRIRGGEAVLLKRLREGGRSA